MSCYIEAEGFSSAYAQLLQKCFNEPDAICRPRGMEVKELIAPTIRVLNPLDRLYTSEARSTPMRYLAGEFVWYFARRNDPEYICRYSAFWNQIKNEKAISLEAGDGVPAGSVNSSYGHLLMDVRDAHWGGHAITQWDWALRSLEKDPDSRQAIMHVNRPGHQEDWVKDFPCTLNLQFLVRDGKLHLVTDMRSNDLIMGLTFDFPMFSFFQETMLYHLRLSEKFKDLELGHLTLKAGSSHIYDRNYGVVEKMLAGGISSMGPVKELGSPPVTFAWGSPAVENVHKGWALSDLELIAEGKLPPDLFANEKLDYPVYDSLARAIAPKP